MTRCMFSRLDHEFEHKTIKCRLKSMGTVHNKKNFNTGLLIKAQRNVIFHIHSAGCRKIDFEKSEKWIAKSGWILSGSVRFLIHFYFLDPDTYSE
jgi:hypothetical protein